MLYKEIEKNKRKTIFFVFLAFLFFSFVGYVLGQTYFEGQGLLACIGAWVVFFVYFWIVSLSASQSLMAMNGAKEITSKDEFPMLWNICEDLAMASNVPLPRIYVIEEESPNAFAAGFSPEKASVAITRGLLEKLNRQEIEAVMAHEFSHIRHYDIRLSTMVMALSSALLFILQFFSRMRYMGSFEKKNKKSSKDGDALQIVWLVVFLVLALVGPLLMTLIRLAISRKREYLADAGAVELTNNPDAMISALRKIEGSVKARHLSKETASLYFLNPFKHQTGDSLFSTHPSTENRIKAIENL